MRYLLTPVSMTIIKTFYQEYVLTKGGEKKEILLHFCYGTKSGQELWKTAWSVLRTLTIQKTYNPSVPPVGLDPEKHRDSK